MNDEFKRLYTYLLTGKGKVIEQRPDYIIVQGWEEISTTLHNFTYSAFIYVVTGVNYRKP